MAAIEQEDSLLDYINCKIKTADKNDTEIIINSDKEDANEKNTVEYSYVDKGMLNNYP